MCLQCIGVCDRWQMTGLTKWSLEFIAAYVSSNGGQTVSSRPLRCLVSREQIATCIYDRGMRRLLLDMDMNPDAWIRLWSLLCRNDSDQRSARLVVCHSAQRPGSSREKHSQINASWGLTSKRQTAPHYFMSFSCTDQIELRMLLLTS